MIVAFQANNVPILAKKLKKAIVVIDHDPWRCSQCDWRHSNTGTFRSCDDCGCTKLIQPASARYTRGLRNIVWQPPHVGDANDHHMMYGLDPLAKLLIKEPIAQAIEKGHLL